MRTYLTLLALLTFSFGFSQNFSENFTASNTSDFEDFNIIASNTTDVSDLEFTFNSENGDVEFKAPSKVDLINIYDSYNQEIFSAKGDVIENGKINLAYLPEGTYYLEIVDRMI